jgi:hypothetical protein
MHMCMYDVCMFVHMSMYLYVLYVSCLYLTPSNFGCKKYIQYAQHMHDMHKICTKYESTYIQYIHIHTIWIDLCVCMCMYLQMYTYTYSDSYIPNTYVQNFACICMYGMYVHVYACICMHEPTSKYACCQQQQMNSSEIPLREPEKQQTQTAKDVRELNNIHNWI